MCVCFRAMACRRGRSRRASGCMRRIARCLARSTFITMRAMNRLTLATAFVALAALGAHPAQAAARPVHPAARAHVAMTAHAGAPAVHTATHRVPKAHRRAAPVHPAFRAHHVTVAESRPAAPANAPLRHHGAHHATTPRLQHRDASRSSDRSLHRHALNAQAYRSGRALALLRTPELDNELRASRTEQVNSGRAPPRGSPTTASSALPAAVPAASAARPARRPMSIAPAAPLSNIGEPASPAARRLSASGSTPVFGIASSYPVAIPSVRAVARTGADRPGGAAAHSSLPSEGETS